MSVDETINALMAPVSEFISAIIFFSVPVAGVDLPLIVVWLSTGGIAFTFYLRFINIRGFRLALRIVRGDYAEPEGAGEVSHFHALSAAVSGTVGLGNIAGVAVAITLGGPGATLWMILAGFLGMSLKFVEVTLAVKYRRINPDGSVSGGPMYYLQEGFALRGWPRFGRAAAVFFSAMCVPAGLGLFSANQSFQQFSSLTGLQQGWLYGVVVGILVGCVIIGGIKCITRVTSWLVPLMCGIYLLAGIAILIMHARAIPAAAVTIIQGAFAPDAVAGGVIGVAIQGFRRAAFSCEAGLGSAPIAHSAVRTSEPVTEGLVALLEPFIDTVVVCTMTALVIVVTGMYRVEGLSGIGITAAAFESSIGWFPVVFTTAVILFAFSTIVSWSYYGLKAWTHLWGESRTAELVYKSMVCASVVVGSAMDLRSVIDFVDSVMFAMSIPNILMLYLMAAEVRSDLESYVRRVASGEIAPARRREPQTRSRA